MLEQLFSPRLRFILAIAAFACWGIIARGIHLPMPVMLTVICAAGAATCLGAGGWNLKWNSGALVVGLILSADLLLLMLAFRRIDFATVVALHNAGPLLVIVFARRLTGDPFRPKALLLATIGIAAVAVICGFRPRAMSLSETYGLILALLSAGTFAANTLTQRRLMKTGYSYRDAVLQYNIVLTAVYAAISIFSDERFLRDAVFGYGVWCELGLAAIAGALTQGVAMMFFNSAAQQLSSDTMARLSLLGPGLTVATGALLYSEWPSAIQVVALATILVVSLVPISVQETAENT
jgi:drug/metabolite transporter (DMT)-like permease